MISEDRSLASTRIDFDPDSGAGPVPSPCINVCRISPVTGWCEGCQRRLEEIGGWGSASDDARRDVLGRIRARRADPGPKP